MPARDVDHPTLHPPTCYTAVRDDKLRRELAQALGRLGWRVIERPSGFHLIQELSDAILEHRPRPEVRLVVVEDPSPGCRGSSLARGLRELGIDVPVTLIAPPDLEAYEAPDEKIFVVEPELAPITVPAIARHYDPALHDAHAAA